MRVMVLIKANERSDAGVLPTDAELSAMGKFNDELVKAGVMLAGDGLHPSKRAVRVKFPRKDVVDGPFAETKELVAGYWIWQVKSIEEAVAWIKRAPADAFTDGEVEIRPIFELSDFEMADETRRRFEEQERALRAQQS